MPKPISCHERRCSDHQSPTASGTGESAPPLTWPSAVRVPTSSTTTTAARASVIGLGDEPGERAGVGDRALVAVLLALLLGPQPGGGERGRVGLGGGDAAPLGDVGSLVEGRGHDVPDEVEAVAVGQPGRGQEAP